MESRLIELEVRYSHLERQCQELSHVVFEQQKALQEMRQQLRALHSQMNDLGEPAPNDRPPHY